MKYVIELRKVVKRVVVIEASNDDEADSKMLNEDIIRDYTTVTSDDCYNGWSYQTHEVISDEEDLYLSAEDIAEKYYGCDIDYLNHCLFKYTESGMSAIWDNNSIQVCACVEGADCDGPSATLTFPCTKAEWEHTLEYLDEEADAMWHEWNDDEGDD